MEKKSEIQKELDRIQLASWDTKVTDEQYCNLYSAQQALAWVLDSRVAARPFDTIMNGKVWLPIREVVMKDNPAN